MKRIIPVRNAKVELPTLIGNEARIRFFFEIYDTPYEVVVFVGPEYPCTVLIIPANTAWTDSALKNIAAAVLQNCSGNIHMPDWVVNSLYDTLGHSETLDIKVDWVQILLCEPELA